MRVGPRRSHASLRGELRCAAATRAAGRLARRRVRHARGVISSGRVRDARLGARGRDLRSYLIFFALGVGTLFSWNAFITAAKYPTPTLSLSLSLSLTLALAVTLTLTLALALMRSSLPPSTQP